MGKALWRMGQAWCLAVLALLALTLLIVAVRDGLRAVTGGFGDYGLFAIVVVLSPGLLLMLMGGMLGGRRP